MRISLLDKDFQTVDLIRQMSACIQSKSSFSNVIRTIQLVTVLNGPKTYTS